MLQLPSRHAASQFAHPPEQPVPYHVLVSATADTLWIEYVSVKGDVKDNFDSVTVDLKKHTFV